ncbi:TlpA family protein disulfide reductase [Bacteroides oleiciplenus]|uniref:Thioredoxin domain-containing protein n=2 Tax=Bacteroides oleiciplenus TaxID=626931 RepID=K9DV79_9BACE|nr:TlpA disulfide reductase family protein [Bacteroides oleiciplenus]EKU88814.1 hypothetical protein HMPREF9447_04132 [Bacteroides oleiciplenus YIT 12058]RGN35413.1 TlpA family protein disulfide reductase [Bacteroides oleiciplenus]
MKRNSLFLFLSMMFVWVGLCSAQTTSDKYYLIDGYFFNGMPPGVRSAEGDRLAMLQDDEGHSAWEIRLGKGKTLPEYAIKYRIPVEEVPGGEELLRISRSGKAPVLGIASNSVTLDEWVGKPFPDFKVTDTTGRVWTKADILGKPFVLNYWHTGCGPCIKEMSDLNEWMKVCPDVTYFSTTWNTAEQIKKIVENRPFLFTHIADELFFFNLFKVQVTPTTLLVDKKGIIRYWDEGTNASKREFLFDKLKELSAE